MSSIVRGATIGLLGLVGSAWLPLAAQTNLKATATAPTTVVLTWTAAAGATGYWVKRGVGSGSLATITSAKLSGTTYTDGTAPAGATLRYQVKAGFAGGPQTFSATVSVTTPPAGPSTASAPPQPAVPAQETPAPLPPGQPVVAEAAPAPVTLRPQPQPTAVAQQPTAVAQQPTAVAQQPAAVAQQPALVAEPNRVPLQRAPGRQPAPAPTPAPAPSPAPAAVTPVNPSGFIAKQTGDGEVQLSWQPIDGASYYVVLGPGVPEGGTRVSGATTFTATGVPAGSQEWAVASYYEPGPVSTPAAEFPRARLTVSTMALTGWADLHTHPMIHLAFAGKLVHGAPDVGSLLPQDLTCNGPTRATSITHALGSDRPSHGGHDFLHFKCGDELRKMLISEFQKGNEALQTGAFALGAPDFGQWPAWNDITHQKMWFEWVRRARDGGLRVMVALATNNRTLGEAVSGPGDGPTDDKASADLQLTETKAWVNRHTDFMELAFNAADIKRIAQANKIAVVLGVEIDNIGNFNLPALAPLLSNPPVARDIIAGEIQRLYAAGVRYVIPVHVSDNVFGGAAIYKNDFNTANLRETGRFWSIECANVEDNITHTYTDGYDPLRAVAAFAKLGMDPFRRSGPGPDCPAGQQGKSRGHRNAQGLTYQGVIALKEMMKRGIIVDIDHMSQKTADATLDLAETFGYPIVSGHSGIRGQAGADAENSRTKRQLERISKLHGMFGLGTDGAHRNGWASQYQTAMTYMGYQSADTGKAIYRNGAVAFGTDLNGLVKGPRPGGSNSVTYDASFPKSSSANVGGSKYWDYNTEGVAHYGMMADFVRHVRTAPSNNYTGPGGIPLGVPGSELVDHHLNRNANYFWLMWQRIEARKGSVQ